MNIILSFVLGISVLLNAILMISYKQVVDNLNKHSKEVLSKKIKELEDAYKK